MRQYWLLRCQTSGHARPTFLDHLDVTTILDAIDSYKITSDGPVQIHIHADGPIRLEVTHWLADDGRTPIRRSQARHVRTTRYDHAGQLIEEHASA